MRFKFVFRYSRTDKILRLFRVIRKIGHGAGYGAPDNYHSVFKLAISKKPFYRRCNPDDKVITFLFMRFTLERSFGGIPV